MYKFKDEICIYGITHYNCSSSGTGQVERFPLQLQCRSEVRRETKATVQSGAAQGGSERYRPAGQYGRCGLYMFTENISFVCVIVKKQVLILTSEPIGALTQLMGHGDNAVKNVVHYLRRPACSQ